MRYINNFFCRSAILVLTLVCHPVSAAPGNLDTSFGGGAGWVATGFGLANPGTAAQAVVQQRDGKLVVAGGSNGYGITCLFVARYNSNGSLDTTFNGSGVVTFFNYYLGTVYSIIQQTDGKLVVGAAGVLIRFNSNGSLDTTFSGGGIDNTGLTFLSTDVLTQQADGKLLITGLRGNCPWVARFNIDGTLDTTFHGTGSFSYNPYTGGYAADSVVFLPDGSAVTAGIGCNFYSWLCPGPYLQLYWYNPTGLGLRLSIKGPGSYPGKTRIMRQTDGKVVVVEWNTTMGFANNNFEILRYSTAGVLEWNRQVTLSRPGYINSVIQQSDGKLVLVGRYYVGDPYSTNSNVDFLIIRLNTDGSVDTSFDADGIVTTSFTPGEDYQHGIIQQSDGRLVVVGTTGTPNAVVARYNTNGSLDTTFDTDGIVTYTLTASRDDGQSVIQQADGKLVLGGEACKLTSCSLALVRYNIDGSLDTSLDGDGKLVTAVGSDSASHSVFQQGDGKLVAAGSGFYINSSYDFLVTRYNSNGSMDLSFNLSGMVTTPIGTSIDDGRAGIQQMDGKLVVAGYSNNGRNNDIALVRYNSDGSLDSGFNGSGKVITPVGSWSEANAVIQQMDGKLVVAGYSHDIALVRYNSDGSLDSGFNGSGEVITPIGIFGGANAVIQQMDGKLVVAGYSNNGSNNDIALVRYNSDGSLDSSFNGTGKVMTAIGTSDDLANSLYQQSDGKLVVTGQSKSTGGANGVDQLVVVRYNLDGSLDTTFNGSGKLVLSLTGMLNGYGRSVIQQADGKLVIAGYANMMFTGGNFFVVRLDSGSNNGCKPGKYLSGSLCVSATPGYYVPDAQATSQLACPAGTYNPNTGGSSISACMQAPAGSYSGAGAAAPTTCPAGDSSYAGATSVAGCFADADGDGLPDAIDANAEGFKRQGNTGVSVALADMDGDGYADILVGTPGADKVTIVKGRRHVIHRAGNIRIISGTTGQIIASFDGLFANQHFGTAFAVVPDQNGDGLPDLVVGEPLAKRKIIVNGATITMNAAGNVSLYSGADGTFIRIIAEGSDREEYFGAAVAVGDVNNDAVPDLVVGSPGAKPVPSTELPRVGKVTVFNGLTDNVLYSRFGSQRDEYFGAAVAFDSQDKFLLVGSPGYDSSVLVNGRYVGRKQAGQVQIFDATDLTGSSANLFSRVGDNKGDHFGASVSSFSQDITGDSQTDWAVGIPGADILNIITGKVMKDAGKVQLFSGFNSSPVTEITGANAGDNEGSAVSATGDINGDGINDLAIGASKYDVSVINSKGRTVRLHDAGRVEVVSGSGL